MGTHYTQRFEQAYIEALYFTDTGTDSDIPSDARLSPETRESIKQDCARFLALFADDIGESGVHWEQAGHDFWLTRNGHGAGFWDRPELYGQALADKLTAVVGWRTDFPESEAYAGDDGLIYLV